MYDPAYGRFTGVDPLADSYAAYTPYHYVLGNPLRFVDPDGRSVESTIVREYTGRSGRRGGTDRKRYEVIEVIDDGKTDVKLEDGTIIGHTLSPFSFKNGQGAPVIGAIIDVDSDEASKFLSAIVEINPVLSHYMPKAIRGNSWDFKNNRTNNAVLSGLTAAQHLYRGFKFSSGLIMTARDVGNYAAGLVAARNHLSWSNTRTGFDGYETIDRDGFFQLFSEWRSESVVSQVAQQAGYKVGLHLERIDLYNATFGSPQHKPPFNLKRYFGY